MKPWRGCLPVWMPTRASAGNLVWGNDLQSAWMDWFGQVRCRMPAGADAQAMERIDTLLANLRMRVDRIRRRERNIARYRTNLGQSQRMQSLVRLTQNTTLAGLTNELRRELPRLGVERYFAALYDGYDRPPMPEKLETPESGAVQPDSGATVLHALGFGPEADSAVGTRFSDACVVPPDITLGGGRFSLIAELIAFGTEVDG